MLRGHGKSGGIWTGFAPCLKPMIGHLQQRVPELVHRDLDLLSIARRIIAGDSTYLTTAADAYKDELLK